MTVPPGLEIPLAFRRNAVGLEVVPRTLFCARYFHYKPGQHVLFGGPSTHGKTSMAFDLLEYTATPELPCFVAQSKPRDPVTETRAEQLGLETVSEWPPPKRLHEYWRGKPRGYVVKPKFGDLNRDMSRCAELTAKLLNDRYTQGVNGKQGIAVMDDTMIKAKVMGLDGEMVTILAMAGAMGLGLWTFVQKVTDSGRTPLWAYSQSAHKFLLHDPVQAAQKVYADKVSMDWRDYARATGSLEEYQFLYVNTEKNYLCVVDAKR